MSGYVCLRLGKSFSRRPEAPEEEAVVVAVEGAVATLRGGVHALDGAAPGEILKKLRFL